MNIVPSEYQEKIFDFVENDYRNLVVNAVPGSGKTTTVIMALKRAHGKILVAAYNKAIETELSEKAPKYAKVKTLNALGHGLLLRKYGQIRINKNKFYNSIKKFEDNSEEKIPFKMIKPLKAFFEKARAYGFGINIKVNDENLNHYFDFFQVDLDAEEDDDLDALKKYFLECFKDILTIHTHDETEFDFGDQVYIPVYRNISAWTYDNIFLDEAQDISPLQLMLMEKFCSEHTRLFFVGDRHQSIYAFRGADHNSMDTIKKKFECVELPLSISYRCPTKVLGLLEPFTPDIKGKENNEEGKIDRLYYHTSDIKFPQDSLILCRTNAPLVKVGTDLLAKGQDVSLNNPELKGKLFSFIKGCNTSNLSRILELAKDEHARWASVSKVRKDVWFQVLEAQEIYQSLNSFYDISEDLPTLKNNIEKMFTYRTGCIQLLTVHKAKGLESDNVYIINEDLFDKFGNTSDERIQENNCKYVALSRARKNLTFLEVELKDL